MLFVVSCLEKAFYGLRFKVSLSSEQPPREGARRRRRMDPHSGIKMIQEKRFQPIVRYPLHRRMPLRGISILRLLRGPFGLTGRRLNGQARRLFGLGQTRKSLCGTSVSKGLLVPYITPLVPKHATYLPDKRPSAPPYRHPERRETPCVRKAPARTSGD